LNTYSQGSIDSLEIYTISETLPGYLNNNPNSAASYLRENDGYIKTQKFLESISNMGIITDSIERTELKNQLKQLDFIADSLKIVLLSKKIQVRIQDSLYGYHYVPKEFEDLRKSDDWEIKYDFLKEDFNENKWVRLDTTISMEFADLIKKQIDSSENNTALNLNELDNRQYEFINTLENCKEQGLCFDAYKLYRPVFNVKKDKACYLFSFNCRSGICRDFIFIERLNGIWTYIESYPSHLIGYEE
jgi:hypothetical protein